MPNEQTWMENADRSLRQDYAGLHVAVIMDGNGRWAMQRGLPRVAGHRAGVLAARRIVEAAVKASVARLTLYTFSSDNWRRPLAEVQGVFQLLTIFLRKDIKRLHREDIRLQVIGRRDRLPEYLLREIEDVEETTRWNSGLRFCIALDYSSRDAIAFAATRMAAELADKEIAFEDEARNLLGQNLTGDGTAVDLLIRTGGEKRLSDFLLWESAYAELFFTNCMWPDFTRHDFMRALKAFRHRDRRFGGVALPTPKLEVSASSEQWRLRF